MASFSNMYAQCTGSDGPVCLTPSLPLRLSEGPVSVNDTIGLKALSQCHILKSAVDSGGEVKLPPCITMAEFKTWNACNAIETIECKRFRIPVFGTVLKVGHALGDPRIRQWTDLAAALIVEKLDMLTYEETWYGMKYRLRREEEAFRKQVSQILADLPEALQQQLLISVHATLQVRVPGQSRSSEVFDGLFMLFPASVHSMALQTSLSQEGSKLSAHIHRKSLLFAKAFADLAESSPTLKEIDVYLCSDAWHRPAGDEGNSSSSDEDNSEDDDETADTAAAQFSTGLQQQTSLTNLGLAFDVFGAGSRTISLHHFSPALCSMTGLEQLRLGQHCIYGGSPLQYNSFPALRQILSRLHLLKRLEITLLLPETRKRLRDADAPESSACLASTLSPATVLTFLQLNVRSNTSEGARDSFQLVLPCLRHLCIQFSASCCGWMQCVLTNAIAPLSKVCVIQEVETMIARRSGHVPAEGEVSTGNDVSSAPSLAGSLLHFPDLHTFQVRDAAHDNWLGSSLLSSIKAQAASQSASFQHLQVLDVAASASLLRDAAPLLSTAFPCLQRLVLRLHSSSKPASTSASNNDSESGTFHESEWQAMFRHISSMQLQSLKLHATPSDKVGPPLAALACLACLAELNLSGYPFMRDARDFAALEQMKQLRRLALSQRDLLQVLQPAYGMELISRLSMLACLTSLELAGEGVGEVFARYADAGGLQAAWPALEKLSFPQLRDFHPMSVSAVGAIVRGACSHPCVRQLVLDATFGGGVDLNEVFQSDFAAVKWEVDRIVEGSESKLSVLFYPDDCSDSED